MVCGDPDSVRALSEQDATPSALTPIPAQPAIGAELSVKATVPVSGVEPEGSGAMVAVNLTVWLTVLVPPTGVRVMPAVAAPTVWPTVALLVPKFGSDAKVALIL